jgi:hypothetical protein
MNRRGGDVHGGSYGDAVDARKGSISVFDRKLPDLLPKGSAAVAKQRDPLFKAGRAGRVGILATGVGVEINEYRSSRK